MAGLHAVHFGLPPLQPDETSLPFMALPMLEPGGAYEAYVVQPAHRNYLGPFPVFYGPYIGAHWARTRRCPSSGCWARAWRP